MATHTFDTFEVGDRSKKVNSGEIVLSDDQKLVYDEMHEWAKSPSSILTVGGFAGTGKTTLLAKLIQDLGESRFMCATFTGRAANILAQKIGVSSVTTIHSAIYRPTEAPDGTTKFEKKAYHEVGSSKIFVIDEASMIGASLYSDIESFGMPILAVGDHGQLPPIEGPSVLMASPMLRLEKIHRQAEGSPIIRLSKTIRETGRVPMPPPKGIRFISMNMFKEEMRERTPSMTTEQMHDFAVLCYKNVTRNKVNQIVREARFGACDVSMPMPGDLMVCLRNMPPVYNGMRGTLEAIKRGKGPVDEVKVSFPDDGIIHIGPAVRAQFGHSKTFSSAADLREVGIKSVHRDVRELGSYYDYGYCLTTHKAQGSSFKTVYWIRERSHADEETYRRWMYTSATRASEELVVVAG